MKHITFYLDFISPYAYLAFEKLPEALMGHSYSVAYKPALFAALLKHLSLIHISLTLTTIARLKRGPVFWRVRKQPFHIGVLLWCWPIANTRPGLLLRLSL